MPEQRDSQGPVECLRGEKLWIDPELPILEGHFPGMPLVPAALQLEWMLRALPGGSDPHAAWTVQNAKFLKPLRPGDRATIRVEENGNQFRAIIECGDVKISQASFRRDR
jgi:3-hydroxymyristoyl/3-hydroxydecanoyl-(acyl carrier protein) dehydratase